MPKPGRKGEHLTLGGFSAEQKLALELLAAELGFSWGESGNVSAMVKAIADGELEVVRPWSYYESEEE